MCAARCPAACMASRHGARCRCPAPRSCSRCRPGRCSTASARSLDLGEFAVANVHLSHGQVLNRRQLRRIAEALPPRAAVLGDYNLVGPALLPGFRDVGPREPTHVAGDLVPLRIDRCLVRGLPCLSARGAHAGGVRPPADRGPARHRHASGHRRPRRFGGEFWPAASIQRPAPPRPGGLSRARAVPAGLPIAA